VHGLFGAFIKSGKEEIASDGMTMYPFRITFPKKQVRIYYSIFPEE
jgi:hypothetical protein